METTTLYVELIIIGAETSAWIALIGCIIDDRVTNYVMSLGGLSLDTLLLLPVFYVIGIIVDRLIKRLSLFEKKRKKIKENNKLKDISSYPLWEKNNRIDFYSFTEARIRILRGTVFNLPLITITFVILLVKLKVSLQLLIFAFSMGIGISIAAWFAFCFLYNDYYKKTKGFCEQADELTQHN